MTTLEIVFLYEFFKIIAIKLGEKCGFLSCIKILYNVYNYLQMQKNLI